MAHSKVYGFCDAKCKVEVAPKGDVEKAQSTADGKVSKHGDVMDGLLHLTNGLLLTTQNKADIPIFSTIRPLPVSEVNSYQVSGSINIHWDGWTYSGGLTNWRDETFTAMDIVSESKAGSQTRVTIWQPNDGNQGWISYPSWNLGVDDDSDKILTIKMANRLPSLVRTDANQNVGGDKHFLKFICQKNMDITSKAFIPSDYTREHGLYNLTGNGEVAGYMVTQIRTDGTRGVRIGGFGVGGHHNFIGLDIKSNGDTVGFAPNTPNNANGNEIATAGWVNGKLPKSMGIEYHHDSANVKNIRLDNVQAGDMVSFTAKGGSVDVSVPCTIIPTLESGVSYQMPETIGEQNVYLYYDSSGYYITLGNLNLNSPTLTGSLIRF